MSSPHEEECSTGEGALSGALYTKNGTWIGSFTKPERARLAVQAPRMARALLACVSDRGHAPECGYSGYTDHRCSSECAAARSVLKAAGVLE